MTWVRRHRRAGTTAWLLAYAVSFVALIPRDCCAAHAHRAGASESAPCHDAAAAAALDHADGAHCPMPAELGAACPMHGSGAPPASEECQLTGVCNVPAAALSAVVMSAAVPVAAFALSAPVPAATSPLPVTERLVSLVRPPDSPPPRRS